MELKKNVSMLYIKKVNDKLEKRIIEVLADRALSIAVIKTILNLDDNRIEELILKCNIILKILLRNNNL